MTLIQNWATYPSQIAHGDAAASSDFGCVGRRARVAGGMLAEGAAAGLVTSLATGSGEAGMYAALVPVVLRIGQAFYYQRRQ